MRGVRYILKLIDAKDILTALGLIIFGAGVWMIFPPATFISIGLFFLWLGLGGGK